MGIVSSVRKILNTEFCGSQASFCAPNSLGMQAAGGTKKSRLESMHTGQGYALGQFHPQRGHETGTGSSKVEVTS